MHTFTKENDSLTFSRSNKRSLDRFYVFDLFSHKGTMQETSFSYHALVILSLAKEKHMCNWRLWIPKHDLLDDKWKTYGREHTWRTKIV